MYIYIYNNVHSIFPRHIYKTKKANLYLHSLQFTSFLAQIQEEQMQKCINFDMPMKNSHESSCLHIHYLNTTYCSACTFSNSLSKQCSLLFTLYFLTFCTFCTITSNTYVFHVFCTILRTLPQR